MNLKLNTLVILYSINVISCQCSQNRNDATKDAEANPPQVSTLGIVPEKPSNFTYDLHNNSLTASPILNWDPAENAATYEIAIGSSSGTDDIYAWTDVGDVTSIQINALSLSNGKMYFAAVRSISTQGLMSEIATGPSWQNLECPDGYIKIYGNTTPTLGGANYTSGTQTFFDWDTGLTIQRQISDFCVMKFEAKDSGSLDWSDRAVSTPSGFPWTGLRRSEALPDNDAIEACESIGTNYHLMSKNFWLAILHDIESVEDNFDTSLLEEDHAFNWGHANDADYSTSALSGDPEDENGCFGIGTETFDLNFVSSNCNGGWHRNKRTHFLKNGEIIWDMSGNVAEWGRDEETNQGVTGYVNVDPYTEKLHYGPLGDYTIQTTYSAGLGYFRNGSTTSFAYGGFWADGDLAGLFHVNLNLPLTFSDPVVGFRCIYIP